jgi:FemAB-related protein (PEP-CTERM system-associated)
MESTITVEHSWPDKQAWDTYVLQHPQATFFHLFGWQQVVQKNFRYHAFLCVARRNGRLCGILPLFLVRILPFGHALVSTPWAPYGGVCADDNIVLLALIEHAKALATDMNVRYLELRNRLPCNDLPAKDLYVTFRREIFKDAEKNMAAIPRKQRRMIRQGDKHGLIARIGGQELLSDFYQIYSHSVRNHGTPVFAQSFFVNLMCEFGDTCRILAVSRQGQMIAGVMTFFFRDQVLPHYAGALREGFRYAVNDFMYWHLLCYGAEEGYRIFDFGRSKCGTGSYNFKRHWGLEPTPLAYQYYLVRQTTVPDQNPLNPRFALPIRIWKQLPLGMTQWLGPKLVHFFP